MGLVDSAWKIRSVWDAVLEGGRIALNRPSKLTRKPESFKDRSARSTAASTTLERSLWVGSSSSQAGETVVHGGLTPERQVSSALLPEFTDQVSGC